MTNITNDEHKKRVAAWVDSDDIESYKDDMDTYNRLFEAMRSAPPCMDVDGPVYAAIEDGINELLDAIMPATGRSPEGIVTYMMTMAVLHAGQRDDEQRSNGQ